MINKKLKKLLPTALAICIISTVCSTGAFASELKTSNTSTFGNYKASSEDNWQTPSFIEDFGHMRTRGFLITFKPQLKVELKHGHYVITDYKTDAPVVTPKSHTPDAKLISYKISRIDNDNLPDRSTVGIIAYVHCNGGSVLTRAYFMVDPNTGAIRANKVSH